jgi:nicotinamidase-related amidase
LIGLRFGDIGPSAAHLCVDVQRLFSAEGPWPVAWLPRVLPVIGEIVARRRRETIFTRFLPPFSPSDLPGRWRAYYDRWREVTLQRLDPRLVDLVPELAAAAPPAIVVDKHGYSAFTAPALVPLLAERHVDTLVVTGGETDVCVLATVLAAVDRGFRVVLVADGICSSSDADHDRILSFFAGRLREQIEVAESTEILSAWRL